MCGLVGALTDLAVHPALAAETLTRMRDRAAERGPDAGGLHLEGPLALAHRRLAVVGLGEDGAQPAVGTDWVLAYNGELYELESLRTRLRAAGRPAPARGAGRGGRGGGPGPPRHMDRGASVLAAEANPLGEGELRGPVDRVGLAAHVGLPRVGARLAAAARVLLAAERAANLGP